MTEAEPDPRDWTKTLNPGELNRQTFTGAMTRQALREAILVKRRVRETWQSAPDCDLLPLEQILAEQDTDDQVERDQRMIDAYAGRGTTDALRERTEAVVRAWLSVHGITRTEEQASAD